MDILQELNEIQRELDQVLTDSVDKRACMPLNKAKNRLAFLIADGERREVQKDNRITNPAGVDGVQCRSPQAGVTGGSSP